MFFVCPLCLCRCVCTHYVYTCISHIYNICRQSPPFGKYSKRSDLRITRMSTAPHCPLRTVMGILTSCPFFSRISKQRFWPNPGIEKVQFLGESADCGGRGQKERTAIPQALAAYGARPRLQRELPGGHRQVLRWA